MEVASDRQASDILLLDVREVCSFADYFVIMSGDSQRQMKALQDEIDRKLSQDRIPIHHLEGTTDSGWVLLDLGAVIIHIFDDPTRRFYQLDQLWSRATPLVRMQ